MTWCSGCGPTSDTSEAVQGVSLSGPAVLNAGSSTDYVLRTGDFTAPSWRVIHACLRLHATAWTVRYSAPMNVVVQDGKDAAAIPLSIKLLDTPPPGVYSLIAVVVAQAEMWVSRRPVQIGAPSPPE
jgi:hypothetical protein